MRPHYNITFNENYAAHKLDAYVVYPLITIGFVGVLSIVNHPEKDTHKPADYQKTGRDMIKFVGGIDMLSFLYGLVPAMKIFFSLITRMALDPPTC